jgi:outer membrane protein assembly factor BamB
METLKYLFLAAILQAVFSPVYASAETRRFVLKSGSVIEAELVDVKPGYVRLKRDAEESSASITDFSDADRRYFRDWLRRNRGQYDWPGERGVRSDGSTDEALSDGAPTVLWRADVGGGQAAVVSDGKFAFTTGIRGGQFVIVALKSADGQEIWSRSYPVTSAPQLAVASPAVDAESGLVFTMGPAGRLDGWQIADGENVWATGLAAKYPDAILPLGGVFGSPLVESKLYVEVGGPAYSLVGFTLSNGSESWRIGKHRSIGATPVRADIGARQLIVSRNEYGIVGRRTETGTMAWDQEWKGSGKGRASAVVVESDRVFVTSEKECAMFRIDGDRTEKVWSNSGLCSEFSTPIYQGGFIYGFNGNTLTCLRADSGETAWSSSAIGGGNLIRAADKLLIVTRRSGELVIADADPEKYVERSRSKVFDGESRTIPVLANGRIFCRSVGGAVTCLEMRVAE